MKVHELKWMKPKAYDSNKTNCVMNYDYSKYNVKDIQAFCREKGISISFKNKEGKKHTYSKDKLVEKLVKHYLKNKFGKKVKVAEYKLLGD